MSEPSKLAAAAIILLALARLVFLPCDILERDTALRAANQEYRSCMDIDILCAPSLPCPQQNCMGEYLRRSAEISGQHALLSVLQCRTLLVGWQPYWNNRPAP
jgi:hypothetical protein